MEFWHMLPHMLQYCAMENKPHIMGQIIVQPHFYELHKLIRFTVKENKKVVFRPWDESVGNVI
jgi:hypothetical protein